MSSYSNPRIKRAIKASLLVLAIVGFGTVWQSVSSERVARRAEAARAASLQMTPQKWEALAREARIEATAKAYAAKVMAEREAAARRAGEAQTRLQARQHSDNKG